jgi:hypothetical protein
MRDQGQDRLLACHPVELPQALFGLTRSDVASLPPVRQVDCYLFFGNLPQQQESADGTSLHTSLAAWLNSENPRLQLLAGALGERLFPGAPNASLRCSVGARPPPPLWIDSRAYLLNHKQLSDEDATAVVRESCWLLNRCDFFGAACWLNVLLSRREFITSPPLLQYMAEATDYLCTLAHAFREPALSWEAMIAFTLSE